jgi:hypothetical protein
LNHLRTAEEECEEGPANEDQCPFAKGLMSRRSGWHIGLIRAVESLKNGFSHPPSKPQGLQAKAIILSHSLALADVRPQQNCDFQYLPGTNG